MKTFGWVLLILGVLSFMGAASKGHDVFGPCFCIGVGGLIVYLKREKEEINNTTPTVLPMKKEPLETKNQVRKKEEIVNEVQPLSYEQKEAAICLVAFFAGYTGDLSINGPAYMLGYQSSVFFGIDNYKEALPKAMAKYQDADKLMDTIMTIKDRKSKEFLLLTCYDLTKMSNNAEAYEFLSNIANEMGYNETALKQLVKQYS